MKTILRDLMERGVALDEASDIPDSERRKIIRAWRESASKESINEAYLGGEDDKDMATLLAFCLDEVLTHQAQQAMLNCFWAGMSWRVDGALQELHSEMRQERKDEEREFKLYGVAV